MYGDSASAHSRHMFESDDKYAAVVPQEKVPRMKLNYTKKIAGGLASLALAALPTTGCSGDPAQGEGVVAPMETGPASAALASAGCRGAGVSPGTYTQYITSSGISRKYIINIPSTYRTTTPARVVLYFHGLGGDAAGPSQGELKTEGENNNYVTVFPEGAFGADGKTRGWNAGSCCTTTNDVQFARDVVADVSANVCVDSKRVFATGFSMGALLTYRLACEAADVFAAGVSVAGSYMFKAGQTAPACNPVRPISFLEIHDTADSGVCYAGNTVGTTTPCSWDPNKYMSVDATNKMWRAKNGVSRTASIFYQNSGVTCERWSQGRNGSVVERCKITDSTVPLHHCTPGASGGCTASIGANTAISAFTAANPMP